MMRKLVEIYKNGNAKNLETEKEPVESAMNITTQV